MLATHLNELVLAINSAQASPSRPPMITKGGIWAKTAGATDMSLMFYDGTTDHVIGSVVGGVAKFGGGATFNSGATAAKPATPIKGDMFFDTTLSQLEVYDGGAWVFQQVSPTIYYTQTQVNAAITAAVAAEVTARDAAIAAAVAKYLPLAGGALTGALTSSSTIHATGEISSAADIVAFKP